MVARERGLAVLMERNTSVQKITLARGSTTPT
jgi:hypothetical protein